MRTSKTKNYARTETIIIVTFDPMLLGSKFELLTHKGIIRMPESKGEHISHKIKKSVALAWSHFLKEKGITFICAMQRIDSSLFASISEGDPDPLWSSIKVSEMCQNGHIVSNQQ